MGEVWTNGRDELSGAGGLRHSGEGMCQEGKGWGEEGRIDFFFLNFKNKKKFPKSYPLDFPQ